MANVIKFDCNYPKLCNQAKAKLVWVDLVLEHEFISEHYFLDRKINALLEYDTKCPDGTQKDIEQGNYYLLFFVGDKGIMFSTLRKRTKNNEKYLKKIGQWFDVEVKNGNVE